MLHLSPATTALILIDLQNGIVGMDLAPRSGTETVAQAKRLAGVFRQAKAPVVLVNVAFAADFADALRAPVDRPLVRPGALPKDWSVLVEEIADDGDLRVTKHQWGAFHGTALDTQLRRRGVKTVVIGGIATNMGVESTARQAHEHGYEVVIAEDATSSVSAEMHQFAISSILPMLARVTRVDEIALDA